MRYYLALKFLIKETLAIKSDTHTGFPVLPKMIMSNFVNSWEYVDLVPSVQEYNVTVVRQWLETAVWPKFIT